MRQFKIKNSKNMSETIQNAETINRLMELGGNFKPQTAGADGVPFVIIPSGMKAESMAAFLPPPRIDRTVTLLEAGSFADYVNRFKMPESLIFVTVTETGCTFRAMLDYHAPAPDLKPSYCKHQAVFTAVETPDWKVWKAADRQEMKQVDFAKFIENNARFLVEPAGAVLLELVRSLHGHKNARFSNETRLDNGAYSVTYDEDVVIRGGGTSTTAGDMELPAVIKAGIAVFQGAAKYEISARLKTRIEERRLILFFETIALTEIVRESILLLVTQISEKTGIVPLIGTP